LNTLGNFLFNQVFELTDTADFTDDWFRHKVIGLTGKITDEKVGHNPNMVADSRRVNY
jgi:hypothetical protein